MTGVQRVLFRSIWPFEAKLQAEDYRSGARLAVAEMLTGGTTTMLDMYFNEDGFKNVEVRGLSEL